jgi:hypothetical protein
MRSTILDNRVNEKIAAAEMLKTPAMAVVSKMENKVESMLGPENYATKLQIRTQASLFGKRLQQKSATIPSALFKYG